jgi:putative ABC transport system permease protein
MAGTLVLTDTMGRAYDGIAVTAGRGTDADVRSSRVVTDPDQGVDVRGTVDDTTLALVRSVPTVADAEPHVQGIAQLVGRNGRLLESSANRSAPIGLAWQDDANLNPMELVAGHAPRAPNEVVIDRRSARMGDIEPGQTVPVVTKAGSATYTVAGIVTYGGAADAGGAQVIAFTPDTATRVLGSPGRYDSVLVKAVPGVSQQAVVADITAALGRQAGVEVRTGAAMITETKAAARARTGFIATFLVAFAVVALLVGSFVIANGFSITVAQRSREHALLRAIGATRRQVLGAVLVEAVVTGLVASIAGVILGIATAFGLRSLLSGFGFDLPAGPMVVTGKTVVASAVIGTVVAVAAAFLPARRAAAVPPIAALRDAGLDRSGRSVRRTVAGVAIAGAGVAAIAAGLNGAGTGVLGLGAVLVFLGAAALGPVLARPAALILGAPLTGRGIPGVLARQNASRNPRRTAATASALMIGVALVAFMTILAASAKSSIATKVDQAVRGDWIVSTEWGQGGLSSDVTRRIDALPETAAVTGVRYATASVDGKGANISAFDPAVVDRLIDLDVTAGNIARLSGGGIAVRSDVAESRHWTVGDRVTVDFPETGRRPLDIVAIYRTEEPMGQYAMSLSTYDANVTDAVDHYVVIADTAGVSPAHVRAAVDAVLAGYPTAKLQSNAEFKAMLLGGIDQLLALVDVLLLLAVVIALFGIANTLALSIHERTREIGLLRAVGMTRRQLRSAVRWEAVLIALLGTGLGLAIGYGFGWALVRALANDGLHGMTVPTGQLAAVVVVGALAGVVASISPARRAAKLDVLAAISHT